MSLHILRSGEYYKQQKTCRYYISKTKDVLLKRMKPLATKKPKMQFKLFGGIDDGTREHEVEAGYKIQMFNTYFKSDNYNIDYDYYIGGVRDIINKIQLFKLQDKIL